MPCCSSDFWQYCTRVPVAQLQPQGLSEAVVSGEALSGVSDS